MSGYHAEPSILSDWHCFIYTLIIWKWYLENKDDFCSGRRNKAVVSFIHFLVFTVVLSKSLPCEACLVSIKLLCFQSWKDLIKSRLFLLTARFHNSGVFRFDTQRYIARFIQRVLYIYKSVNSKNSTSTGRSYKCTIRMVVLNLRAVSPPPAVQFDLIYGTVGRLRVCSFSCLHFSQQYCYNGMCPKAKGNSIYVYNCLRTSP